MAEVSGTASETITETVESSAPPPPQQQVSPTVQCGDPVWRSSAGASLCVCGAAGGPQHDAEAEEEEDREEGRVVQRHRGQRAPGQEVLKV